MTASLMAGFPAGCSGIACLGNVMVVDDQPANLRLMEDILQSAGHGVRSFPRGRLALTAAAQQRPDLILLDITMPEMDGFEVCTRLKSDAELSSIPVIFLSALSETEDKVKAFNAGGVDYIGKPFHYQEVLSRVETHLRLHELQERVEVQNTNLKHQAGLQLREIEDARMATIFALAKLADSRNNDSDRHLERIRVLCQLLAIEMSASDAGGETITDEFVENVFCASPLHDIGKVAIPDAILLKPGELTYKEFKIMKTHTTRGAETLSLVLEQHPANSFVRMGIDIARSHHEWWDGTGYPHALRGKQIPLCARILAVADCYDALRSQRCYREAWSREKAAELIIRGGGNHFDPEVVSTFCKVRQAFEGLPY